MTALPVSFARCVQDAWQARKRYLGCQAEGWERELAAAGEAGPYLMYVLGTLPISDLGEYPPALFAGLVCHALRVREEFPWCGALPLHMFLKDVLYPRINTEELEGESRPLFYRELAPLVKGLGLSEAILEVNRWCAGQVTYRSTDDRTSSPLDVYRRGWGRCGEESTFTVTALRSVGIPARQVYAPWWSHCDDNHAWVEAWDGGSWRYLGACEPEPDLDRGWFTGAAARAMLIHTRAFVGDLLPRPVESGGKSSSGPCPFAEGLAGSAPKAPEAREQGGLPSQKITSLLFPGVGPMDLDVREGVAYESVISRYAPVRPLSVTATDKAGRPLPGASITFSVLNMGAFQPIAQRVADKNGQAILTVGLGSLWIAAQKGGLLAETLVDTRAKGEAVLTLAAPEARTAFFRFDSPKASEVFPIPLAPAQKAACKAMLEEAAAFREEKQARRRGSVKKEKSALPGQVLTVLDRWDAYARRPAQEMGLEMPQAGKAWLCGAAIEEAERLVQHVLDTLSGKDRADGVDPEAIADCAKALQWEKVFPEDVFLSALLSPRVGLEPLRPWRGAISFDPQRTAYYREAPYRIWQWVCGRAAPQKGYGLLPQSPLSALSVGAVGKPGQGALFCAICRVLGIPARLSPLDGSPEYWQEGRFVSLESQSAVLALEIPWEDAAGGAYSLSRLGPEGWRVLHVGAGETALPPGDYRLLTCLRLPSGDQLAQRQDFTLEPGQRKEIRVKFPEASPQQLLQALPLPAFSLSNPEGHGHPVEGLLQDAPYSLFCWLEPGREPTEHLLLELRDAARELAAERGKCALYLVTERLGFTVPELPWARCWQGDFSELPGLARQLFVDPDRLPLVLLADSAGHGLYANAGYNVGSVQLLLRLLAAAG